MIHETCTAEVAAVTEMHADQRLLQAAAILARGALRAAQAALAAKKALATTAAEQAKDEECPEAQEHSFGSPGGSRGVDRKALAACERSFIRQTPA